MYVDIRSAGEVINVSVCGVNNADRITMEIFETIPNAVDATLTPTTATRVSGPTTFVSNVACNDPFTGILTSPQQFVAPAPGTYEIRLNSVTSIGFNRVDVTVTPDVATPVDPTANGGRLHAYVYAYNAGAYSEAASTDTNYYVKVPGGNPGENYVWQLDLDKLAGFVYDIVGNAYGVDSPNSGFSVNQRGNGVTPEYPIYLSYPDRVGALPSASPSISSFQFRDNANQDNTISPNDTTGIQDSGVFSFTTDVVGTYSVQIDINQDGLYSPEDQAGNPSGDVFLNGVTNGPSSVNVPWDGRSNTGAALPSGIYNAKLEVRIGEYHFIAGDVETSGGPSGDGLTIYQAMSQNSLIDTRVFWDDKTFLGGTTTLPYGALSSTPSGKHNWGNFTRNSFGDVRYIDTFVYGDVTIGTTTAVIAENEEPVATNPSVALTKRITAINRGKDNEQIFDNDYVDVGSDSDEDNDAKWPGEAIATTIGSGSVESYISGIANGAAAGVELTPGKEIEYTISFLSNGSVIAQDIRVCDRIPENTTFVSTAFDTAASAEPRGILLSFKGADVALTNANDGDEIPDTGANDTGIGGYYFSPGIEPSTVFSGLNCGGANTNGAIVVDLSDVVNATGDGSPANSYGFIRFLVTVD